MDVAQFARDRLRQAREEAKLSQREMAKLLGMAQATVSDIERGRVQMSLNQLADFAARLGKPLSYFLPAENSTQNATEAELIDTLHTLPPDWWRWVLNDAKRWAKVHDVIQPYLRAHVPEEFYDDLIYDAAMMVDAYDTLDEMPTDEDLAANQAQHAEREERYRKWREMIDAKVGHLVP